MVEKIKVSYFTNEIFGYKQEFLFFKKNGRCFSPFEIAEMPFFFYFEFPNGKVKNFDAVPEQFHYTECYAVFKEEKEILKEKIITQKVKNKFEILDI